MGPNSSLGNITNLPLSDPKCNSDACLAFKAGHLASQAQISWASQFLYGHYITWYYLAIIFLAMLVYAHKLVQSRRLVSVPSNGTSVLNKALAFVRLISYRRIHGRLANIIGLPSLGMLLFVLITCLFLLLLAFIQRPYYRLHRGFGSPPLAVRTGLMAIALTPIIVALAGKVNFITILTGISHEKLNVLHRYASYMCLFLSIVHTVPFIVAPLKDGGLKQLHKQYYKKGGLEFTGTPPLGILVGLCVFSIPWIRHKSYSFFYRLHIPLYVTYLGLIFWHATQELDSWAYLWATLAIYLASITSRAFVKCQSFNVLRPWFQGYSAHLTPLSGDMTRVDVIVSTDFKWKAGQHCWLRFPHLSILHNHPFTIASLPKRAFSNTEKAYDDQTLRFYIRSYRGLTKALAVSTEKSDQALDRAYTIHVDGPYGGLIADLSSRYDQLIFVAGGGGISACLPLMLQAAIKISQGTASTNSIHLIWMVREEMHTEWAREELKTVISLTEGKLCEFNFFVTDSSPAKSSLRASGAVVPSAREIQASTAASTALGIGQLHYQRPFLLHFLPGMITGRRVMIFGKSSKD
ncbi:uncharacterized protein BDR25DRAFT_217251 [Lindgomyces ingoldianus]|uniref:Uncharacterized protein n=1 Tax=Lindgomyces ingoldianus TaxID=673940 RepID=A0ACB6R580_9PLEO|nr:uncharacterized protein BDR25DRAFT_217251 [Lindgomyces ingoldianus]KAF2473682.1 hypothetical protein BDR25DRAFT_217251 [Lindgomyces ingoldianus]